MKKVRVLVANPIKRKRKSKPKKGGIVAKRRRKKAVVRRKTRRNPRRSHASYVKAGRKAARTKKRNKLARSTAARKGSKRRARRNPTKRRKTTYATLKPTGTRRRRTRKKPLYKRRMTVYSPKKRAKVRRVAVSKRSRVVKNPTAILAPTKRILGNLAKKQVWVDVGVGSLGFLTIQPIYNVTARLHGFIPNFPGKAIAIKAVLASVSSYGVGKFFGKRAGATFFIGALMNPAVEFIGGYLSPALNKMGLGLYQRMGLRGVVPTSSFPQTVRGYPSGGLGYYPYGAAPSELQVLSGGAPNRTHVGKF